MTAAAIRAATHGFALALSLESLPPNLSYDGTVIVDPTAYDEGLLVRAHLRRRAGGNRRPNVGTPHSR